MRAARRRGEGPFPAPVISNRARTLTITGEDGNEIPLRVSATPNTSARSGASPSRRACNGLGACRPLASVPDFACFISRDQAPPRRRRFAVAQAS
jgi:hypothetical protein